MAPSYAGGATAGAAMRRAEAKAKAWFAAAKPGDAPDGAAVLSALRELGDDWPTQARPNVTDTGRPVPGVCLGLVMAQGKGAVVTNATQCFPELARFLVAWCAATLPKTRDGAAFPFSSLQVNYNYAAIKHVDANNIGPSYIQAIGEHTGGALWTADQGALQCHGKWKLFDGNREHATEPFAGRERISFIAFANVLYAKLDAATCDTLRGLGFTAAGTDGVDLEFFERFRIERSYLSDAHNAKFKACLAARRGAGGPSAAAGAVAVECYGRQAARGGGWFAYAPGGGAEAAKLELKENSVGIWLAELALRAGGGGAGAGGGARLELKSHERINLYKDPPELAKLQKRVAQMPAGAPVLLGIADTACAAKRPLGKAVYACLRELGAPADMPPIEYRKAWAMIGFKGAAPGAALTAMGTRSTLLRLDATFARDAATGATSLARAEPPDLTNIIDVVTGGGQDCAVRDDEDDAPAPPKKKARAGAAAAQ